MANDKDPHGKWADEYDRESIKSQWHGPAILFGLLYPHLKKGDRLLDLGIGTGLGTVSFHRAGLVVHGMDGSPSMLERCAARDLGFTLVEHDLTATPWPYKPAMFKHIISTGVFHFVGDLGGVMAEASRVISPGGLFGFDIHEFRPDESDNYHEVSEGVYSHYDSEYDVHLFRHSAEYVIGLLGRNGFEVVYDLEFLASHDRKSYFRTLVARR